MEDIAKHGKKKRREEDIYSAFKFTRPEIGFQVSNYVSYISFLNVLPPGSSPADLFFFFLCLNFLGELCWSIT